MGEVNEFANLSIEELQKLLQQENDASTELSTKLTNLVSENAQIRKNLIEVELEEEAISNQLLKRLDDLKRERGQLLRQVEEEEEHLTNTLIQKLDQLRSEKVTLEIKMESEEEYITNKFLRLSSTINADISALQKKLEDSTNIDERIESCKAKILELKKQISNETKQNFNLEMKTRKLRSKTEKLTNENFILHQQILLSRSKLMELKNQKTRLESNFERQIERTLNEEQRKNPFALGRFQSDNTRQGDSQFSISRRKTSLPEPTLGSLPSSSSFKTMSYTDSDEFFPFDDDDNDFNDSSSNDDYQPRSGTASISIPKSNTGSYSSSPGSFIPIPNPNNRIPQKNVSSSLGANSYLNPKNFGKIASSPLSSSPASFVPLSSSFSPSMFLRSSPSKSPTLLRKRTTSLTRRSILKSGWLRVSFSDLPDLPTNINTNTPHNNSFAAISSSLPSSFHSHIPFVPSSYSASSNIIQSVPVSDVHQTYWSVIYSTSDFEFFENKLDEGMAPRYRVNLDTISDVESDSSHTQYTNRLVLITKNGDRVSIQFEKQSDFLEWKSLILDLTPC